jgi:HAD superfamily hydrolase (TIGR01509 family)
MNLNFLPAAVIFDMDGVLIDSNPFHVRKWETLLTEHGIPFDRASLPKQVLGPRNGPSLRHFFGAGLTAELQRRLSEELEVRFRRDFGPHAKPFPGVRRLIAECQAKGTPMALASSAMSKNVNFIVDALNLRASFQVILSGDEVTRAKPYPEIYVKAAAKLGLQPPDCVAIEDSFVGIEAAKSAGMKCVGVASTFPARDLQAETRADLVIPTLEALDLQALQELFRRAGDL